MFSCFFFQAEDGIRDLVRSRGLGDVYKRQRQELTEEIAGEFAQLARSLRQRGHEPEQVAHFINLSLIHI